MFSSLILALLPLAFALDKSKYPARDEVPAENKDWTAKVLAKRKDSFQNIIYECNDAGTWALTVISFHRTSEENRCL
jgi:hypothetical protein